MKINVIQKDTFEIIRSAVNKTVNLIRPTYGPASNKVIISKVTHQLVVDDGVQIARDLEFDDANENAVLKVVREAAIRTNDRVGDGTTSSLIMLQAIIEEVAKLSRRDGRKIEKQLKKGFEEAKKQLLASARPIKTKEELVKVARISFDDPKVAEIIAATWYELGKDGVVTVDRSGTMETFADVAEGITMKRGYLSPYMITNPQRMEALIEKPYIMITDYRLTEVNDIITIMNKLAAKQIFQLVLICDNLEQNALATAIVNKMQGKFLVVAINKPEGDTTLEDIALMTGARMFSEKKGDKLEEADIADLGRADRFICHRTDSVIVGPRGKKDVIKKAIADLNSAILLEQKVAEKYEMQKRLANFTNKVAVIKVGAPTENEVTALKYKVEDSVNAVKAALKGGVVCGAGLALSRLVTSSELLNEALKAPFRQLKENTGIESHRELKEDEAINATTGKIGNFLEVGVVDPVEVLLAGVDSAISIASLLITTTGMIVEKPKHIKEEE
jgi:chaperonin GroEL